MDKDLINDFRAIVLPVLQNVLIKKNFEGRGLSDALELEKDFNEILRLAEKALDSQWIPITMRPIEEDEKFVFPDATFIFDCPMPEDGQQILISTKYGVEFDTCFTDDGCYLDSNRDWEEVYAWQPLPEPYKKGGVE